MEELSGFQSILDPESKTMTLSSIRHFILGEDPVTRKMLGQVDLFLKGELNRAEKGTEKRLAALFYAIVTKTRLFPVETPEMRRLFRLFIEEMDSQLSLVTRVPTMNEFFREAGKSGMFSQLKRLKDSIEFRLKILDNKVRVNQMRAFLFLCEYYVHFLERAYKELSMSERVLELYVVRMDIRKIHFFFERKFGAWFGFTFFRSISAYGTSFGRLALTCFLSIILF